MKKNLFTLLALAALASCSQDDLPEQSKDDNPLEIKMKSAIPTIEALNTRAPVNDFTSPLTAKVMMTQESGKYVGATGLYDGTMSFTAAGLVTGFATPQYYPAEDATNVYLIGLYPSTGWGTPTGTASTTAYTFDGKTDVMSAAEVTTTKVEGKAGTYPVLAFKHLLTNLIIQATVDGDPATVKAAWGKITGISLAKAGDATPNNALAVTMQSGQAATASAFSGATAVGFYQASGAVAPFTFTDTAFDFTATPANGTDIPSTASTVAYSLIAPVVAVGTGGSTNDFELLVTTANNPTGVPVSLKLSTVGDTQGQYCVVTLSFKATQIQATATITPWAVGGTAGGEIQ